MTLRARAGALVSRATGFEERLDALRAQIGGLESRLLRTKTTRASRSRVQGLLTVRRGRDHPVPRPARADRDRRSSSSSASRTTRESNTRFLLVNDNWRGLVLDGGDRHVAFLRRTGLDWRHDIDAKIAFIDRDNINGLIASAGIAATSASCPSTSTATTFWVLEAIDVVSPRILVFEYNSTFGPEAAVTVPYDPAFVRGQTHWSNLYWGASLAALTRSRPARATRSSAGTARATTRSG